MNMKRRKKSNSNKIPVTTAELIELNRTMSSIQLAEKFGVSREAISYRFRSVGYKPIRHPRQRKKRIKIDLKTAYRRYENGESLSKIAADLQVSQTCLRVRLKGAGYPTNLHNHVSRTNNAVRKLPPVDKLIKDLRQADARSVAARYGAKRVTVYAALRRAGISIRDIKQKGNRSMLITRESFLTDFLCTVCECGCTIHLFYNTSAADPAACECGRLYYVEHDQICLLTVSNTPKLDAALESELEPEPGETSR